MLLKKRRDINAVANHGDLFGRECVSLGELAADGVGDCDVARDVTFERALDRAVAPARAGGRVGARQHVVVCGHHEGSHPDSCEPHGEPADEPGLESVRVNDIVSAVVDDPRERSDCDRVLHRIERAYQRNLVNAQSRLARRRRDLRGAWGGDMDLMAACGQTPRESEYMLLHPAGRRPDHHQDAHAPSFRHCASLRAPWDHRECKIAKHSCDQRGQEDSGLSFHPENRVPERETRDEQ